MMGAVHFVIESDQAFFPRHLVDKYLIRYMVSVSSELPRHPERYRLIVLWNLRKVVTNLPGTANIVVFHSSDLPKGRGWAPIYHALASGEREHVITGMLAGTKVDAGDVIAKARFTILPSYTADNLRPIDEEVCVMMAAEILERFESRQIEATPQSGEPTYNKRRMPSDSQVDPGRTLIDLVPHIRACSSAYPAYFDWNGCRYHISLEPRETPAFPTDLKIEFPSGTCSA